MWPSGQQPCRAAAFDGRPRRRRTAPPRAIAGDRPARPCSQELLRFRHGPAAFKLDYALSGPVPWRDPVTAKAATVHVGGTFDEIAAAERRSSAVGHPERPFVLVAQSSLFDPTRAPAGRHTLWAYCHVPNGSTVDITDADRAPDRTVRPGLPRHDHRPPSGMPADIDAGNPNQRRWRHQRWCHRPTSAVHSADGVVAAVGDGYAGSLPVLVVDAAWCRGSRHVRLRAANLALARELR